MRDVWAGLGSEWMEERLVGDILGKDFLFPSPFSLPNLALDIQWATNECLWIVECSPWTVPQKSRAVVGGREGTQEFCFFPLSASPTLLPNSLKCLGRQYWESTCQSDNWKWGSLRNPSTVVCPRVTGIRENKGETVPIQNCSQKWKTKGNGWRGIWNGKGNVASSC